VARRNDQPPRLLEEAELLVVGTRAEFPHIGVSAALAPFKEGRQ